MPYIEGRVVHDADAHVVETPDWLVRCADPSIRDRVPQHHLATTKPGEDRLIAHFTRKHRDAAYRAHDAQLEKGRRASCCSPSRTAWRRCRCSWISSGACRGDSSPSRCWWWRRAALSFGDAPTAVVTAQLPSERLDVEHVSAQRDDPHALASRNRAAPGDRRARHSSRPTRTQPSPPSIASSARPPRDGMGRDVVSFVGAPYERKSTASFATKSANAASASQP